MDRRAFLRGTLTSAAGVTAMVQVATLQDMAQLTAGPIALGNIEPQFMPSFESPEVYMRYRGARTFVCIGLLKSFQMKRMMIDVTRWEGEVTLIPGLERGSFTFEGEHAK